MKITDADYKRLEGTPAVLCDFDDTIANENVAELLLDRFGTDGWKNLQRQHSQKMLSLKDYQERAFSEITVGREPMKALVKQKATLRPYFRDLWEYCTRNDIPLVIVSMGLDFYIEALLEREGMESIPFFAVETEFTEHGINFGYGFTWDQCWQPGNCKCRVLERYRDMGYTILYAGDGKSDISPATKSDVVFARHYLEDHFKQNDLPYIRLTDFSKILDVLKGHPIPFMGDSSN